MFKVYRVTDEVWLFSGPARSGKSTFTANMCTALTFEAGTIKELEYSLKEIKKLSSSWQIIIETNESDKSIVEAMVKLLSKTLGEVT